MNPNEYRLHIIRLIIFFTLKTSFQIFSHIHCLKLRTFGEEMVLTLIDTMISDLISLPVDRHSIGYISSRFANYCEIA